MENEIRVGYIGLGIMGQPMARNILEAGFPITVYNRTPDKMNDLIEEGAKSASSPMDVAKNSDIVFTNVTDSPDVLQVVLGAMGIIHGAHPGLIFVDNSTIRPDVAIQISEELSKVGIVSLDAPVSGGEIGAINGTLTIMVGGPTDALAKVLPVLNVIGKKITHVGAAGAGQVAKAANQIMVGAQMVAMGELLIFAQKYGVDTRKVVEAIRNGAAQCWTLDQKPQRLFVGKREPGFKAGLQAKDLRIVMESAEEIQLILPLSAVITQLYADMLSAGRENQDNSAIISIIEDLNSVRLIEDLLD